MRTFKWPGRNRVQHIERLSRATCRGTWDVILGYAIDFTQRVASHSSTMASFLLSVALLVLSIQTVPSAIATKADPLVRVSDDNWQIVLEGEWMLEL